MRISRGSQWLAALIVVIMVFLGPLALAVNAKGPFSDSVIRSRKISAELQNIVKANPDKEVRVIVQGSTPDYSRKQSTREKSETKVKQKFEEHGGKNTRTLGIIGGASGTIKPERLAALAKDSEIGYIAYDAQLVPTGNDPYGGDVVDYTKALNADQVWPQGIKGKGVSVVVIDSGVDKYSAGVLGNRYRYSLNLVDRENRWKDPGGHGTHVAGIIAGVNSPWSGVAPEADIISIRVTDDKGYARMSTVIQGIQWSIENRKEYGIRVINLSLGVPVTSSYSQDPLAGAVEMAWRSGIVVVAAAGNMGPAPKTIVSPGYDPFLITVGAMDMNSTTSRGDDLVPFWSSRGPTFDGFSKPDVVAPGRKIVSTLVPGSYLSQLFPDRIVAKNYLRLSGTSQATAAVSGVVALILSKNPSLTPDQVKQLLMASATPVSGNGKNDVGAGYVDAARAIASSNADNGTWKQTARPADTFAYAIYPLIKNKTNLVWKYPGYNGGADSRGRAWSNVTWDNVTWDNVTWDNVAWDNVAWDNVTWDNTTWDNTTWDNTAWDNTTWDNTAWDNTAWDNTAWD